jgi:hypothetical protein
MRIHSAVRHAFAVLMGLVCAFTFSMGNFQIRPQWMSIPFYLVAVVAVLFLTCRFLGPPSLGLLLSYCAPVSLTVLLFVLGEGLISPKLEPFFAVSSGALASLLLTLAFERLLQRATRQQKEI